MKTSLKLPLMIAAMTVATTISSEPIFARGVGAAYI
jgi:hypothetical protein